MKQAIDLFFHLLDWVLVLLLAGMTVMVFSNVVLRYGFNSGIDISEEMSRFFFVWLIFLGAISAMRHNMHMGFDLVLMIVPKNVRRIMLATANAMVLGICLIVLIGAIRQFHINATNVAPVTRMPMIWVFGVVIPMSALIGLMAAQRMIAYITGRLTDIPVTNRDEQAP